MTVPSPDSSAPFYTAPSLVNAHGEPTREQERIARFYSEYPSLLGELPHFNSRNGANLLALKVTCDACDCLLPLGTLHGVINDYAHCIEVRYAGNCPQCHRITHNVLRVSGDEMRFIKDGKWCVATRRPWWHRLWPWPVDREWS